MAGSGVAETANLATELLDDLVDDPSLLAAYLGTATPRARQAVYRVLASRPSYAVAAAVAKAAIELSAKMFAQGKQQVGSRWSTQPD